jgi:hypothetical protein
MRRRSLLVLAVLALGSSAQAVNYSNEVLSIGVGARALGMGGAYVGIADDSTAVYWNAAGLTNIKHMEVAAVQQGREDTALNLGTDQVGSEYFFMSGGMNLGETAGSLGLAVMRFGVSDIEQTTATLNGDGSPNVIGTFGSQDLAVLLGYGHQLGKAISAGLTAKAMFGGTTGLKADPSTGTTGDAKYTYFGADLGLLVKFGKWTPTLDGLSLGVNLQDLANSGVVWSGTVTNDSETVDANPKVGLAYSLPFDFLKDNGSSFTLAMDADPKYSVLMHYGAEFWYKDVLAFRAGMRQFTAGTQSNEVSFGASFRFYMLQADYAYVAYELTPVQYLSLIVRF